MLREETGLAFEMLTDLCGIDYLGFCDNEWETAEATGSGFSRAAEGLGPGRISWADRPEAEDINNRVAIIAYLLELAHSRRLPLLSYALDDDSRVQRCLIEMRDSDNMD